MQWNPKLRAISSRSKDEICTKILINDTFRQHAVVMEAKFFLVLFLSSLKLSACSTTDFRGEYQEVPGGKVLFTDSSQVDSMNEGIYFEMHEATRANNGNPVIYPTEEWENWATFAYNTIVKHPNGTHMIRSSRSIGGSINHMSAYFWHCCWIFLLILDQILASK